MASRCNRRAGTFDPLYARNGEYGVASLTTLANLMLVGPTFGYSLAPGLRIEPSVFALWKQRRADGVYFSGMGMAAGTAGTPRRVGTSYRSHLRWLDNNNLTLDLNLQYLDAGPAVTEAGGQSATSVTLHSTWRF